MFICTGNICRSPMAEALLRARLATRAPDVTVGSAGMLFDGRPAEARAIKVLAKRGVDLGAHRSQVVSLDVLADAALIIGMERGHVRQVATLEHDFFPRSFTLPEVVALGMAHGARSNDESLGDWARALGADRVPGQYQFHDPAMEIPDPYQGSMRTFRRSADQISEFLDVVTDLAWPSIKPGDEAVAPATSGGIDADRNRF